MDTLFTIQESKAIVAKDYPNPVLQDIEASYLMLNLWDIIMRENPYYQNQDFKLFVTTHGISKAIANAQETADYLISRPDGLCVRRPFAPLLSWADGDVEKERLILQQLRFPKRFGYSDKGGKFLETSCISDFLNQNNIIKMRDRKEISNFIIVRVKRVSRRLLSVYGNDKKIIEALTSNDADLSALPTGAAAGCNKDAVSKLEECASHIPNMFGSLPDAGGFFPYWDPSENFSEGMTVPKNYKSRRFIGKEEPHRQLTLGRVGDIITDSLHRATGRFGYKGCVRLYDQSHNSDLARLGSIDGCVATIDLHAASDSISYQMAAAVLPEKAFKLLLDVISERILISGKSHTLHLFSTMGSRLTFPLETLIFLSVTMVAVELAATAGVKVDKSLISIYGDDIVVPTEIAETVIDLLEACGFVVNREKTFTDPDIRFRESCGKDYYAGYLVTTKYWPKEPLEGGNAGLRQIVELQHRLVGIPTADYFLRSYILQREPKMTESSIGSVFQDIWTLDPIVKTRDRFLPAASTKPGNWRIKKGFHYHLDKRVDDSLVGITSNVYGHFERVLWVKGRTKFKNLKFIKGHGQVRVVKHPGTLSVGPQQIVTVTQEAHFTFMDSTKSGRSENRLKDPKLSTLVDHYMLWLYLAYGPQYEDPLSKLLGVSSRRQLPVLDDTSVTTTVRWYDV